jgi:hypothetical protein
VRVAGLVVAVLCTVCPVLWSQTEYLVDPIDTDPEMDQWLRPHVVTIRRTVEQLDLLYLHIPGSYDVPASSKKILYHASRMGYPAIGLRYPNSWTVYTLCTGSSDPECFEKVRLEILDGVDRSDLVEISTANSITNRVVKLLDYLDSIFPDDHWSRFLDGEGGVVWSKVAVSGHSQGAGHAAMIGHVHRVHRVGMLAGPPDFSTYFDAPAQWLSEPGATPAESYFGFGHVDDALVPEDNLLAVWGALGLGVFGDAVLVDGLEPPFEGSHMLFTEASPAFPGLTSRHSSVVLDRYTPDRDDGSPRFGPVWDEMLFPEGVAARRTTAVRRPGRRLVPQ